MAILVTGGAGYIGSHTILELNAAGYNTVILDNLTNSHADAIKRVEALSDRDSVIYNGDINDKDKLNCILKSNKINACIHFAGLKAVGESVEKPLLYYKNNVAGSINLLETLLENGVKKFIFSSSATVYGDPKFIPITEDCPKGIPTNPYGKTKSMFEDILIDTAKAEKDFSAVILRYFNPIGAHESGRIGEDPIGIPNNVMPLITQVAVGKREYLSVFGNDYNTSDGTGVRDYIHVSDLANGHVKALKKIGVSPKEIESTKGGVFIYNLGSGKGISVLELIKAFEEANDVKIPYRIMPRRPGDIGEMYCDTSAAKKDLGWEPVRDIKQMCKDAWNWQKNNPNGYNS